MLIETSSDLIRSVVSARTAAGVPVSAATLINDCVLTVSADGLSLFRSLKDISDPLGNGLLHAVSIPESFVMPTDLVDYILDHRAGYVGLVEGKVLLIGLNDVRMFSNSSDALRNRNEIVRMPLAQ